MFYVDDDDDYIRANYDNNEVFCIVLLISFGWDVSNNINGRASGCTADIDSLF